MKLRDLLLTSLVALSYATACIAEDSDAAVPAESTTEETSPLTVDVSASVFSDYMFRGLNLYSGTSFQPTIEPHYDLGEYGSISALFFFHISGEGDTAKAPAFFEMDDAITYDYSWEPFTFSLGHLWYTYPDHDDDIESTNEIYASVSIDTMLNPTLNFFHDYKVYDSQYYELNLSHRFEATGEKAYNFTPFINIGWAGNAEKYYNDNGLVQVSYGVSTELQEGDVTFTPAITYVDRHDEAVDGGWWFGVTAGFSY